MFLKQTYNYVLNQEAGTITLALQKKSVVALVALTVLPTVAAWAYGVYLDKTTQPTATLENFELLNLDK